MFQLEPLINKLQLLSMPLELEFLGVINSLQPSNTLHPPKLTQLANLPQPENSVPMIRMHLFQELLPALKLQDLLMEFLSLRTAKKFRH